MTPTQETDTGARTPVRKKALRYEAALLGTKPRTLRPKRKGGPGGQGRPPSPLQEACLGKQAKVTAYLKRKSSKAEEARQRARKQPSLTQETGDRSTIGGVMEQNENRGPKAPF